MTITQTKDWIILLVNSCISWEQLELLKTPIREYWLKKFTGEIPDTEFNIVIDEIAEAIEDRKLIIAGGSAIAPVIPKIKRNKR